MSLAAALTDIVDALQAAGIPAAVDPQNVTPPGVWVQLDTVSHPYLSGAVAVRAKLHVIVGDSGTEHALDALSELYARVCAVVTPNTDTDTVAAGIILPDNPTPLPALTLTLATAATLDHPAPAPQIRSSLPTSPGTAPTNPA